MQDINGYERFIGLLPGCYSMGVSHPETFVAGANLVLNSAEAPFNALTVYGHSTQDGTPTPENPVPIVSAGSVMTTGAQLFDASKLQTQSAGGATVTNNGDGSFTVSGSGNTSKQFQIRVKLSHDESLQLLHTGAIYLTGVTNPRTMPLFFFGIQNEEKTINKEVNLNSRSFYIEESDLLDDTIFVTYGFYASNGQEINPGIVKPMVYQDGDGTWEPYTGGVPGVNPYEGEINVAISDGGTQSQFLTVSAPGGLPGIPVNASELPEGMEPTYVDESGQAWVCDEVDFKRGKYVQRVYKCVIDDLATISNAIISGYNRFTIRNVPVPIAAGIGYCDHFVVDRVPIDLNNVDERISCYTDGRIYLRYDACATVNDLLTWLADNPVVYYYPLATPIETDLPAEEIAAYKALHTYTPNTSVGNDAEAWMKVGYYSNAALEKMSREALKINGGNLK